MEISRLVLVISVAQFDVRTLEIGSAGPPMVGIDCEGWHSRQCL